ncbi:histidine kinase [uncultured Clostridium sp.]|uniref:sensor histidine kinase n=1 Tax=uncultured Clostridium sp. TaxID=59620 RepID=UPI0026326547|nr:histidine kinase [uncultured Clostridium sp.]
MGRKLGFLKLEIIIIGINFLAVIVQPQEGFKYVFEFIVAAIIILALLFKTKVKDEIQETILNGFVLIFCIGSYIVMPNISSVYFYLAVIDAMHMKKNKLKIISIGLPIIGYAVSILLGGIVSQDLTVIHALKNMFVIMVPYAIFILIIIAFHIRGEDKITIRKLNEELLEQNKKLKEYSEQVEVLTLEKERNRVAQELHDSLGHYLMAISMHLNMLEKVKNEEKRAEVFLKTKELVKESIKELRETVYKLKEEANISFKNRIENLEENFKDEVKFINNIDFEFEKESREIKEALYITIKECITNGLKHGNSTEFITDIQIKEKIVFGIKNNGISPKEIKMSNGLLGIRKRIENINGWVLFEVNDGFTVRGEIERSKND